MSSLWVLAALLVILALINGVSSLLGQGTELQYSQFKAYVVEGRVSDLVFSTDTIRGNYQNESSAIVPFYTVRIEDPKLLELLDSKAVRYQAQPSNRWLGEVQAFPGFGEAAGLGDGDEGVEAGQIHNWAPWQKRAGRFCIP